MSSLEQKFHALEFGVRRSIRYHSRRQGFYDGCHRTVNFLGILFGSTAVMGAISTWTYGKYVAQVAGVIVVIASALELVFGTAAKARLHHDLLSRFIELEKEMMREPHTEDTYCKWAMERLSIEKDEPPIKTNLDLLCHNELLRAEGYGPEHYVSISTPQRIFAHFFNLGKDTLPPISTKTS